MKKIVSLFTVILLSCALLCGCGAPSPKNPDAPSTRSTDAENGRMTDERDIADIYPAPDLAGKLPIVGVLRRLSAAPYGTYNIEYVHYPRGGEQDPTLDYSLTINEDGTYDMTVVTDGITANHYGHWYQHRDGNITLFYDEPTEDTAHNVYVSDSMFIEVLRHGKLMIYDNCNVIVLSRVADQTPAKANRTLYFTA